METMNGAIAHIYMVGGDSAPTAPMLQGRDSAVTWLGRGEPEAVHAGKVPAGILGGG